MVQAILEGRKTQTRREVNFPMVWPDLLEDLHSKLEVKGMEVFNLSGEHQFNLRDRFGKPGDILWVRETWATEDRFGTIKPSELPSFAKFYYDTQEVISTRIGKKRPSIHMPKAACRIFLEVVSVKVERLQDISEEDAKAEGVISWLWPWKAGVTAYNNYTPKYRTETIETDWPFREAKGSFQSLWRLINGQKNWDGNPWVWVVEFKRIEKPENFK
jgi:hypothetical protein